MDLQSNIFSLCYQSFQARAVAPPDWVNNPLPSREAQIKALECTTEFDVLVIGGGATGCGVALDSVSRGSGFSVSRESFAWIIA